MNRNGAVVIGYGKYEAGKTDPVMPESPNESEYYAQNQDLIEAPGGTAVISLKEGQALLLEDWCDNVIITIEKAGTCPLCLKMNAAAAFTLAQICAIIILKPGSRTGGR